MREREAVRRMARATELSGISVVGAGSFNPAIFQPRWLENRGLISTSAAESASKELFVTPDLTAFKADWLHLSVGLQQLVISTVDEGRDLDLRDVAVGVLRLLPETPIDALGVNVDAHFRMESETTGWHVGVLRATIARGALGRRGERAAWSSGRRSS